jgi:hypothetical protein
VRGMSLCGNSKVRNETSMRKTSVLGIVEE